MRLFQQTFLNAPLARFAAEQHFFHPLGFDRGRGQADAVGHALDRRAARVHEGCRRRPLDDLQIRDTEAMGILADHRQALRLRLDLEAFGFDPLGVQKFGFQTLRSFDPLRGLCLLHLLASRQGEVLSRRFIASQVWDMNFDSDTNVIEVAIRRLRLKIDDPHTNKLIHTVRGMGYVLEERAE